MSNESEALLHKRMIEALAYTLFQTMPATRDGMTSSEEILAWQGSADTREFWRTTALTMVAALNERGLKVVVGTQRKLEAAVRDLAVVPARMAYDVSAE